MTNGLVIYGTDRSVSDAIECLIDVLRKNGFVVFTIIDHAKAAREVGLEMPDTKVLLFGNPKAGTALMLKRPTLAIDLPSRILVYDKGHGATQVVYSKMEYAANRHGLESPVSDFDATVNKIISSCIEMNLD
ncbi:DUF302 domain-containing protein [Tardisphaera saccharovorans]